MIHRTRHKALPTVNSYYPSVGEHCEEMSRVVATRGSLRGNVWGGSVGGWGRRRGNTLVLVAGILVLLVIIAAAYLTRTQAGRVTATAELTTAQRKTNVKDISEMLAQIPADALFTHPVDPSVWTIATWAPHSNVRRLSPGQTNPSLYNVVDQAQGNAIRYSTDPVDAYVQATGLPGADGLPDHPYNFAPYHVTPYTNWPDPLTFSWIPQNWPEGSGNPGIDPLSDYWDGEDNPLGNPGFGDCRWLRDVEPMRWDFIGAADANPDGVSDRFLGWRHLSYIGTPWNAWRICTDISDVGDTDGDGWGMLMSNLSLPVEQWLPVRPPAVSSLFFDTNYSLFNFQTPWYLRFWLSGNPAELPMVSSSYAPTTSPPFNFIPANFYRLKDLDGDGNMHEEFPGERREDEFNRGSARWDVSRILADSDGDGYTDSFWWLAPTTPQRGIRQVVAVSIIDNNALINTNVATKFEERDYAGTYPERTTRGWMPSDTALVSQLYDDYYESDKSLNRNVGFYDNPAHNTIYDYQLSRWIRHVNETGLLGNQFPNRWDRLDYWQHSASKPFNVNPTSGYTPFTLADELELRGYHGQNYPWIFTRYEWSVQADTSDPTEAFLRAGIALEEASEHRRQLNNTQLLMDNRRKITHFNGARNDELPPWMWWRWQDANNVILPPSAVQDAAAAFGWLDENNNGIHDYYDTFFDQSRQKIDLREREITPAEILNLPGGWYSMPNRLAPTLLLAFTDGVATGEIGVSPPGQQEAGSFFGDYSHTPPAPPADDSTVQQLRKLAAGYAANILAYRDDDSYAPLYDDPVTSEIEVGAIPLPEWGPKNDPLIFPVTDPSLPEDLTTRFLGMEAQPFLVEAFIGHVYEGEDLPDNPGFGTLEVYGHPGNYVDDESPSTTISVVQIANPYQRPIDLADYKIRVGVRVVALSDVLPAGTELLPTREDYPVTAVFYAIDDTLGIDLNFGLNWMKFLDIEPGDHPADTIIVEIPISVPGAWSRDPADYGGTEPDGTLIEIGLDDQKENIIELIRTDYTYDPLGVDVVVDRFDYHDAIGDIGAHAKHDEFRDAVESLRIPPEHLDDSSIIWEPASGTPVKPGIRIGDYWDSTWNTHWVAWARVTRPWGWDVDGSGLDGITFLPADPPVVAVDQFEKAPRFVLGNQQYVIADSLPSGVLNKMNGDDDPDISPANFNGDVTGEGDNNDYKGSAYSYLDGVPDGDGTLANQPWFSRAYHVYIDEAPVPDAFSVRVRKPTFFDFNLAEDPANGNTSIPYEDPLSDWSYPNKGFYENCYRPAFQMLQKDWDFERIGELRNVFLFGHELAFTEVSPGVYEYDYTNATFSEYLAAMLDPGNSDLLDTTALSDLWSNPETALDLGRLVTGPVIGIGDNTNLSDPLHGIPAVPAGARIFDAFVCHGPGYNWNGYVADGNTAFLNAAGYDMDLFRNDLSELGFSGKITPGLINIGTATPEVIQSLPQMYKLVHETALTNELRFNPRVALPEAMVQYRERYYNMLDVGFRPDTTVPMWGAPDYHTRGDLITDDDLRGDRGFASLGELLLLREYADDPLDLYNTLATITSTNAASEPLPWQDPQDWLRTTAWSYDFAAFIPGRDALATYNIDPFMYQERDDGTIYSTMISTDLMDIYDYTVTPPNPPRILPDQTVGDLEEQNLLFSGISNLVTQRSDMFTIYFKVRSFQQNPITGVWDATDPEYIVDESRYVMLVDRSEVNKPSDKPKILYLERLPN